MKHLLSNLHQNRYLLYYLLITVLLFSCNIDKRSIEAVKWITESKKPIKVYKHKMNALNYNYAYTLVDSIGTIYFTGDIELTLPDIIR
jgi:hypothetical protein